MKKIYRDSKDNKVWWLETEALGESVFTIDKKKFYSLFGDYPEKLSVEEWLTFNDEYPYWRDFYEDSNRNYILNHVDELKKTGRVDFLKYFE